MTRRPRLVRVGFRESSSTQGVKRRTSARCRRSRARADEFPQGREDRIRPIRRPGSRSGGRDAARRGSCRSRGRPAAATDRCCRGTRRMRAPRRPSIRDRHRRAMPQGRPRSSPWLPAAADRTPAAAGAARRNSCVPTGRNRPAGVVCSVMSQRKDRKPGLDIGRRRRSHVRSRSAPAAGARCRRTSPSSNQTQSCVSTTDRMDISLSASSCRIRLAEESSAVTAQ